MAIVFVGVDLAKNVFAVHGADERGRAAWVRPGVPRDKRVGLLAERPPCTIRMQVCPGVHHGARQLQPFGHTVRLIAPKFDLRKRLFQMCGVDLTRIAGIDVTTARVVLSEIGTDMGRFPSDKHFASWLGLCPGTKITGGKVMSGRTRRCANRAAQALRLAAAALRTSHSALGATFRRLCARMDKPKAVTAAAHKLVRLIDSLLTQAEETTDQGQAYDEERYRQRVLHDLNRRAQQLGMTLVPAAPAAQGA